MMPTTSTCKALAHALRQELPGDLADANAHLRAENERLRAEVNQLRAAAMSPYAVNLPPAEPPCPANLLRNGGPTLTWQDFAEKRNREANRLTFESYKVISKLGTISSKAFNEEVSLHDVGVELHKLNLYISKVMLENQEEKQEESEVVDEQEDEEEQDEEQNDEEGEEEERVSESEGEPDL